MKANIFLLLALVLLIVGSTARTHIRVAHTQPSHVQATHSADVSLTDPDFLKVDTKIRSTYPNLVKPLVADRS